MPQFFLTKMADCSAVASNWLSSARCLLSYPPSKPACREAERNCSSVGRRAGSLCRPTADCPRCDVHALRPHICPSPEPLADVAQLFEATYVLCVGAGTARDNCLRHRQSRSSYWPRRVHVEVFFEG